MLAIATTGVDHNDTLSTGDGAATRRSSSAASGAPIGLIVGVVVGAIVLLGLLAALIVFLVKRNRKAQYRASKRNIRALDVEEATELPTVPVTVASYSAFKDAGIAHDQNIRFRKDMEVSKIVEGFLVM